MFLWAWFLIGVGAIVTAVVLVVVGFCLYCWALAGSARDRVRKAYFIMLTWSFMVAVIAVVTLARAGGTCAP